jgi:cytidylate kinase
MAQTDLPVSPHMPPPVVTLAAPYGAGGSVVGPRVAERLGVPFLDRGILAAVAEQMHLTEAAAAGYDPDVPRQPRSRVRRILDGLSHAVTADGSPVSGPAPDEARYRAETEQFLAGAAATGGVVLGRAGAVVLRARPGVLHVRLDGPPEARARQGARVYRIDVETAAKRLAASDRARMAYIWRNYGVDPDDPQLYHVRLDSTVLDLDTCVELIVAAARGRARQAAARLPEGVVVQPAPSRRRTEKP